LPAEESLTAGTSRNIEMARMRLCPPYGSM
jgi:hypothetical protein